MFDNCEPLLFLMSIWYIGAICIIAWILFNFNLIRKKESVPIQRQPHIATLVIQTAIMNRYTCPISMNPLTPINSATVIPCYHVFERGPITSWLTNHSTCPICQNDCEIY